MDYRELEKICASNDICIWGYGIVGKYYAYLSIKCAGAHFFSFCDNKYKENETYEGIPLVSKEELYRNPSKYFVFVAVKDVTAQEQITEELDARGFKSAVFDMQTFTELCSSIEDVTDSDIRQKYATLMDDKTYLQYIFKHRTGKELDLNNPKTFNEKLQWLKINDRKEQYIELADKEMVKEVVEQLAGKEHVIPTIGVWGRFEDIDFDELPDRFVLKCTHDSGSIVICNDKKTFDLASAQKKLSKALKANMYWGGREWPYKMITPRIIAEPFVTDESGVELKDYKVFCFDGEPKLIQVDYGRFSNHRRNIYSTEWEYIDAEIKYPTDKNHIIEKPKELPQILEMARLLSPGFPHVRIDMYLANGTVLFGEYTFYHGSGFEAFRPEELGRAVGDWIQLP